MADLDLSRLQKIQRINGEEYIILTNAETRTENGRYPLSKLKEELVIQGSTEFNGIATPQTEAPTLDGYWVVTDAGKYPNFGGVELPTYSIGFIVKKGNEFIISYVGIDGDYFKKTDKIPNDNLTFGEVKKGDNNVVSGGEVFKQQKNNNAETENTIYNAISGGKINRLANFILTNGFYVNRLGTTSNAPDWSVTNFVNLENCDKIIYKGYFGIAGTSIAFYNDKNVFIESLPASNELIEEIEITRKEEWKKARFSTLTSKGLQVQLIGVVPFNSNVLNTLQTFRIIGAPVYEKEQIKKASIIWNNGRSGIVEFSNWNEDENTFTEFNATCIVGADIYNVHQPQVTFNAMGKITVYPNYLITKIQ